jgi:penicillin-binding protein 1A
MAGAYSAMLNEGNYTTPHTVLRIEFNDGSEPVEPTYSSSEVISTQAAYITAMMMEQDVSGPYSNFMQTLRANYQVYAKTGTSDWGDTGLEFGIPAGSAKDKWMIAGTSEIVSAVWVGYDQAVAGQISYLDRAQINLNIPGHINNSILDFYYADKASPKSIARPEGVADITHVKGVYPYVAPTEATSADMIVTGLIKQDLIPNPFTTATSPIAFDTNFSFYKGETIYGNVLGYDPYSSYIYYTVVNYPSHGELQFDGSNGSFTYINNGDGQDDSFTFQASYSSPATVTLSMLPKKTTE